MKKLAVGVAVLALGCLASACVTTGAQTPPIRQPLEVPPAPPRVIEPAPPQPPPQLEPVEDLPAPPTTMPKPRPPRDIPPREAQKTESKPPETQPVEQPSPAQPAAQPVPPLRTPRTADGAQAERQIREIIGRANALLERVDYQTLKPERRKAYDQAKQFVEGAKMAIKDSKLEYALELADKAETLAKQLQTR